MPAFNPIDKDYVPTAEDMDAHFRVEQWMRRSQHQFSLSEGQYTIVGDSDGVWIETAHDTEPLTTELAESLGLNVIHKED